ncbi:LysM peptidoglycan-binding domain-containing protein [Blastococcus capsensis]|uniref:LysM peptidoglycan-binding domain-containing protein n=1 Tax=Blastococcus capsensis TaxID=1564163 RepID=UPI00254023EB|nr:LysM peptidoglycan-binding domain-containing protein [Blastococcus capsensis]MDK3257870.1 LysM peptidoglycan-binding domain-containing protein [Blastococcus capsensis]
MPRREAGSPAPLRLTARGRRVVVVLLLLVAMGVAAGVDALLGHGAEGLDLMRTSSVVVVPGDTLWSIASGMAGERDVREVIDRIQLLNGLDSASIEPGQVLELP